MSTPNETLTDYIYAEHRMFAALSAAKQIQWEKSLAPVYEQRERVGGSTPMSNPTVDTALDERRLRVRTAVINTERELQSNTRAYTELTAILEEAIGAWEGK